MKIQNSGSIHSKTTQKTKRSSSNGLFGQLLDADIQEQDHQQHNTQQTTAYSTLEQPSHEQRTGSVPMQEAWHTLEESVCLLDKAMLCLETGDTPPQQLIQDIEQLRSLLRQQVSTGSAAPELRQADTLLAVEAERIRAMQG